MARTAKLVALVDVALTRASNRHDAQLHCIRNATTIPKLKHANRNFENTESKSKEVAEMNWVPHPKSGIYFPQGHDWVMDDVPCNAATLGQAQTYWVRNIDGVDKHDPDISSADQYFLTSPMSY